MKSRRFPVGGQFPPARRLAAEYDVSLTTAHKAIRELMREGWLRVKPSRGTFVAKLPAQVAAKPVGLWTGNTDEDGAFAAGTYHGRIVNAIHQELSRRGIALQLLPSPVGRRLVPNLQKMIRQHAATLGGVISFPIYGATDFLEFLDRINIPWVTINRLDRSSHFNYVAADYYHGSLLAADHLVAGGGRNFWILESNVRAFSVVERIRGLQDGLLRNQVTDARLRIEDVADCLEQPAYEHARRLLKQHKPPDAIFCGGDYLALGAMRACQDRGVRVPEDVSVIGYTGLDFTQYTSPPLTVLALPMEEIGVQLVRMLIRLGENESKHTPGLVLPPRLIVRGSTRNGRAPKMVTRAAATS